MKRLLRYFLAALLIALPTVLHAEAGQPAPPDRAGIAPGRVLVKFKPRVSEVIARHHVRARGADEVARVASGRVRVLDVPQGRERQIARELARNLDVEFAEPDFLVHLHFVPNDPSYLSRQWNLRIAGFEDAWNFTTGSPTVTVAVLDTGVQSDHPELAGRVLPGLNFSSEGTMIDTGDRHGHGTHVAGIIAASGNNGAGVAGIAWKTRILPVKVLGADGVGSIAQLVSGIDYALSQGVQILNMSLGTEEESSTLRASIETAQSRGALVIVAAGNDATGGNRPSYPAAYPYAIAVASTNQFNQRSSFSNTGAYIDVAAPGGDRSTPVYSTLNFSDYGTFAGTSQAAAHVSGLAALMMGISPTITATTTRAIIESTTLHLGSPGRNDEYGFGRIDASAALCMVGTGADPAATGLSLVSKPLTSTEGVAIAGQRYAAAVSITNLGPGPWTGPITVTLSTSDTILGTAAGPDSLPSGVTGTVTITVPAAPTLPGTFPITATLTVGSRQCRPSNDSIAASLRVVSPSLNVTPASAQFYVDPIWNSGETRLVIAATGDLRTPFAATTSAPWLRLNGESAVNGTTPATVTLTLDLQSLPAGTISTGTVTVTTTLESGPNVSRTVPVSLQRFMSALLHSYLPIIIPGDERTP